MKRIKLNLIILAFASTCSLQANAGEASKQIETVIGAKILATHPSAMAGYQAILAEKDGKKRVFYESNDGKYMVYGMFYNSKGDNLTAMDVASFANAAPLSLSNQVAPSNPSLVSNKDTMAVDKLVLDTAKKSNYISEGKGKVVYVVFDPNCPYCKELHNKTRGMLGSSEIRWIPIAVLGQPGDPSGSRKVAELFRSKTSALDHVTTLAGVDPSPKESSMTQDNLAVMKITQATQIPLIIWDNKGALSMTKGLPDDGTIKTIFGKGV